MHGIFRGIVVVLAAAALAVPVSAQAGTYTGPLRQPAGAAAGIHPSVACLRCEPPFAAAADREYRVTAAALPRGAAPVIGGLVGAVVGFVAMRIYCADRFCEMGDLIGPLAGAVVGVALGKAIEGTLPLQAGRAGRW